MSLGLCRNRDRAAYVLWTTASQAGNFLLCRLLVSSEQGDKGDLVKVHKVITSVKIFDSFFLAEDEGAFCAIIRS